MAGVFLALEAYDLGGRRRLCFIYCVVLEDRHIPVRRDVDYFGEWGD